MRYVTLTILAFGDSLTAGFGLPPQASFVDQLQRSLDRLQQNTRIINAGVSGDTTAGGLSRIDRALEVKPDVVILELGANDAILGSLPERTKANLDLLIRTCLKGRARVILAGVKPPMALTPGYCEEFAALYAELAAHYDLKLVPDFLEGILHHPERTLADGIHPNTHGVAHIVSAVLPVVLETLAGIRSNA
ncbi:MAG: arylesterase [Desulfohalobiaceae bacterium]|nr:arylesterase [Desulfohalobiaceae bacterium]